MSPDLAPDLAPDVAWYAYAVLPAGALPPAAEPVLPESGFELVAAAGIAALASPVPRRLFDRDDGANRAGDPEWIGARARAHHGVAAAAAAAGACLPLAFGALFASRDSLGAWLRARQAPLAHALTRIAGRSEWTLRLREDGAAHAAWLDRHDPDLRALADRIDAASAGTAFLLERRRVQARLAARTTRLAAAAAATTAALAQHPALTPPGLVEPALVERREGSWTMLTDAAGQRALETTLAALAAGWEGSGLTLALSGPWPPYAFARGVFADD